MDRENQKRIVKELCDSLEKAMMEMLPRFPKKWDGTEIRELFADTARESFAYRRKDNRLGIWKDYENDRIIHNL